jgi:hypothetical protein
MVPTSLILALLVVAFFPATFAYFFAWPRRRIVNEYFAVLGGCGAFMMITLALRVVSVQLVWLSWVLLVTAVLLAIASIPLLRKALALLAARERATAERRAKGR